MIAKIEKDQQVDTNSLEDQGISNATPYGSITPHKEDNSLLISKSNGNPPHQNR